jgi:hypothetical protein
MTKTSMRAVAIAMAVAGAASTVAFTASPAAAATNCKTSTREFPTSGFNADVSIELCHQRTWGGPGGSNSYDHAYAKIKWSEAGSSKFDKFVVQVRLEYNDAVKRTDYCNITSQINSSSSGSYTCTGGTLVNAFANTADGKVTYNLNDDGQGDLPAWDLAGTAKM